MQIVFSSTHIDYFSNEVNGGAKVVTITRKAKMLSK